MSSQTAIRVPWWRRIWASVREDLVLGCVAFGMIGFGAWLRIQRLGVPPKLTWDEHHFVENARNYLAGRPDWNDHPPFGKLLMTVPMHYLGDNSVAWRLAQLVCGLLLVFYVGLLVHWVNRDKTAAIIAAALVSLDGFFVCYSRTALLDGMLTLFALAAITTALRSKTSFGLAVASLLLGSACNIKFSGIVFIPPLLAIVLVKRGSLLRLLVPALVPAAYVAWYSLGLRMAKQPADPGHVIAATNKLLIHHEKLTEWKHPLCSHWYTWFLPTRPVTMRNEPMSDGRIQVMTSLGNPAIWWLTDLTVFTLLGAAVSRGFNLLRGGLRGLRARLEALLETVTGRQIVLALSWTLPVAPWIISRRDSYIYHYLLAYVFGVALLGSVLGVVYRQRRQLGLVTLMLIGMIGAYYAPVWGQLPITQSGFESRLFIPRWR